MLIDVTKENLCINKIVGQKIENFVVEGDMIVPDIKPDILNTISTSGNICIYKKEVLDGKIRIDGKLNTYIVYLADSEQDATRGLSGGIDFTQIIDFEQVASTMNLDDEIIIKSIECKVLNGRKVNIRAVLQIDAKVYSNENIEIINDVNNISDIQTLKSNLNINSLVGEGMSKAYAKDTLLIDNIDNLAEILKTDVSIVNKDVKVSYNKVLAKAEACVKILYLTEDNRIKLIENNLPLMGFVDIANISEENLCDMKYKMKNLVVKPNSIEEHSIYVEVEVELTCKVYETKVFNIIQDMYSPTQELEYTMKKINTMSNKQLIKQACNINESIAISEINGNPIYDVAVRPEITNQNIIGQKIMYEGEITLDFIFASDNISKIDTKQCIVPFNFAVEIPNLEANYSFHTSIDVAREDFVVDMNGNVNTNLTLEFNIDVSKTLQINIMDQIELNEVRNREIYSIIIYFVKEGDTLWKIAKRFRSTVADIARVNNIEDENKIYPGQQLFIPRYVYSSNERSA